MRPESSQMLKLWFKIEQDEDGYPPVQVESIWAMPAGEDLFCLENIPFFAKGVSFKDKVSAFDGAGGQKWYADVVEPSGHSTLRIIVYRDTKSSQSLEERVSKLRQRFVEKGCTTELSHLPGLFAVDVPPSLSMKSLRLLLEEGADLDAWDFEESNLRHGS
jgi:Domain of unknown function (DUF4265)